MLKKPLFNQQKYLDAFIKTAQYVASLTTQQDVWSEILKAMTHFFGSDLVAFGECRADGEIIGHHWALPEGVSCENIFTAEIKEIINEVLESGFLATHQVYAPEEYSIAILPIKQENQTTAVMLVGNRMSEPLVKELLNVYLAVAGLIGATTARLVSEAKLRKHRDHLEELVEERTAELQAVNEELEAFSYSVSHDLRAPLRAIDGFSKMLLEEYSANLEKEGKHYLQRVGAGVQNMSQLIDDLLNLSRIGRQSMTKKKTNLETIVQEAYRSLEDEWKDRKVNFTVHQLPSFFADPNLMQIVFTNLFSNALKFSRRQKAAEIEVGCETKDRPKTFFVKDNGVGFDMKYADRLFTPFQRLHHKEEYEGTGVGLATVRRIIHRHGGRIWVESKSDSGTTIYFTLEGDKSRSQKV